MRYHKPWERVKAGALGVALTMTAALLFNLALKTEDQAASATAIDLTGRSFDLVCLIVLTIVCLIGGVCGLAQAIAPQPIAKRKNRR